MERPQIREQEDSGYLLGEFPNTTIFVEEVNIRPLESLLLKTFSFIEDATSKFDSDFVRLYQEVRAKRGIMDTSGSLNFLIRRQLHLPLFYIFDSKNASEFLEKADFGDTEVNDDKLLLIFRFPDLISQWNKFKYEKDESDEEENKYKKLTPEWGKMIRPLKKGIRKTIKQHSNNLQQLTFDRLNCIGEHKSNMYHYIWEVSLYEKKPEDANCNFQF